MILLLSYAMDHNGLNINYEAKMIVIATGNFDHPKRVGIKWRRYI